MKPVLYHVLSERMHAVRIIYNVNVSEESSVNTILSKQKTIRQLKRLIIEHLQGYLKQWNRAGKVTDTNMKIFRSGYYGETLLF